jgi:hypothetical protein
MAMNGAYRVTYQPQEHHCLSISGRLPQVVDLERGTDSMDFHCDDKQSTALLNLMLHRIQVACSVEHNNH